MSYLDELKTELKKRNIQYEVGNTQTAPNSGSFKSDLFSELKKRNLFVSSGATDEEKYPVLTTSQEDSEDDESALKKLWNKTGGSLQILKSPENWKDVDDVLDGLLAIGETTVGTTGDFATRILQGGLSMFEGLSDTLGYGLAYGADFLGADEVADYLREGSKFDLTGALTNKVAEAFDKASVLGSTTQSVAQGVGQVGAMALLGGAIKGAGLSGSVANAVNLGAVGVSAMGSGMGEAYQAGATDNEALAYGIISGAGESFSEMLFGGVGAGLTGLGFNSGLLDVDDLIAKKASGLFKKTWAKKLVNTLVKATGEGIEEVVSGLTQALGKKLTYMDEESYSQILSDENLFEQFAVGAFTSGLTQASTAAVKNMITKQTKAEDAFVKAETQNRINEKQGDSGKKLTKKEKNAIQTEVENDLASGRITPDVIEKALGGEAYEQYQKLVNESEEFNDLYDQPYEKLSEKQRDRLAELKEKNKASSYDDAIYNAYENLKNQVTDSGKSFKESYNERGRRVQRFQADVSKYDKKYRSTVQKAIDSGILNNTNRSHEFVDFAAKVSSDTGIQIDFSNLKKLAESGLALEGVTVNGVTTKDGIIINMDSAKALNAVVGHEVTHIFEGTDSYNALQTAIFDYAKSKGEFDSRRAALEKLYKGVEGADIDAELTADLVGDYLFTDKAFIQSLSTKHRNVFQKIYDQIKRLCKMATAGSKEARQLEEVKKAFEEVYREAGNSETTKNTAENGGVKYSLNSYTEQQKNNWKNSKRIELFESQGQLVDFIQDSIENKTMDKKMYFGAIPADLASVIKQSTGINVENFNLSLGSYEVRKILKDHGSEATEVPRGQRAVVADDFAHIVDVVLSPETITKSASDYMGKPAIIFTGEYNGRMNVVAVVSDKRLDLFVQTVYVNTKKGNLATPTGEQAPINTPEANNGTVSNTNISPNEEYVNTKYSLSTEEGTKQKQLDIINETNPAPNSYSTWIRSTEDIKTLAETLRDADWAEETEFNPDLSREDIERAIEAGKITVYSSYPIENGVFVSPSAMEAGSYSGDGMLYEKTVNIEDVAWIDPTQGQYAQVSGENTRTVPLEERLSGDALLDAQDLIADIEDVADISPEGYVTVYHRTSESNAKRITESGKMIAKEDGIFFSTQKNGVYASGYGNSVIEMKIPVEKLVLDDIFDSEAHLRIPLKNRNQVLDVSDYLVQSEKFSLSPEGKQGTQYGDYNVYGEEVTHASWEDLAPSPQVAQNAQTAVGDDIAPTREEIAEMDKQRAAEQNDIAPNVNAVNDDIAPIGNSIAELQVELDSLQEQVDELFKRADTNDPQWQQEFTRLNDRYEAVSKAIESWEKKASDVELSKNAVTNISRAVRQLLGLSNKQMADARGLVEKYSDKRIPSREKLYSEVSELFGEYSEKLVIEEIKQVQKDLRTYGISVSEDIKSQIADYNDLRKRNFGKIRFSKDGLAVDLAYQELQEIAPGFFPDDIINPVDQLLRIVDVANMQSEIVNKFDIDADTLWQATDEIINGVNEYKHKKLERMAAKQDIAPVDLNAVLKNSQNRQPSVGVPMEDLAPPIDTANGQQTFTQEAAAEADAEANRLITHTERQHNLVEEAKTAFENAGYDLDEVLKNAKDLSTFATVDNTPQRVMEKALGWHEGKIMSDLTVDRVAQHESEGIKWVNSIVDRLKTISKDHNIKPGSKESAAAQMYAEGFWVNKNNEIVAYGDTELAKDFPNAQVQKNIKALAADTRIRQIYDETLDMINESRVRNGYAPIQRLDNYFLHFRAMQDTFSQLGLPFNPNDIRAKDLPTDLNGVTADLKPGQPYFASAQHRNGKRTSFDLLGGLEMYINSAKNQIYHIDDIQMLRSLRNYIADTYGQAKGLESIDTLSEEAAQERIKEIYNSHLSTFAKFLNEEANVIAGKTSLVDRGIEGILGRRGIQTLETINRQVGANMVGFNVSSSLTNLLSVVQATAKNNKYDMLKAFAQTVSNRLTGKKDAFIENNPTVLRRRGADRFYRTPWQKVSDIGYALAGAVDDVATEMIVRGKYNELTRKGMDSQTAIAETDKLVSRLMGDRSLGQQPQIYNSKMLGIFTKFQLEVRNQLDAMFYDTIQESKASTENITNEMKRNAKTAAKAASTMVQLAVLQHLFGTAFEAVAGYNPAFDIISIMMTAFGWDDDDDSEDTTLDNLEQAFSELLDDLPYTSTLTGGRVPIASALPIEELVTGKDSYGNDKSRLETAAEALPYYLLPGGYGQAKKTIKGLSMFDDDLPVTGSYTDSGNLRFPVEDTFGNRVQAALFGQYANKNGREYFDNGWSTLKENQIKEYAELGISVSEYRKIRSGISKIESDKDADGNTISGSKKKKVVQYIDGLDLTAAQKVTLYNGQYESEKDQALERLTTNFDEEDYWAWLSGLSSIETDKDANGNTISGSRKKKVVDLLNSLEYLDYGQKIILYRSEFQSDDTYCEDIVEYINSLSGLDYSDRVDILKSLGFTISDDGTMVYW